MPLRRPLRPATWLLAVLLVVALGACGTKEKLHTSADTEGIYVDAGPLTYQVQDSRELNPASPEDRQYLQGLPPGTPQPAGDAEWFGVWMRVQNQSDRSAVSSSDLTITDTQGAKYKPIPVGTANPFTYQAQTMPPGTLYPDLATPTFNAGPQAGVLLLFQLKTNAYQNRPLELKIGAPGETPPEARVSLDL